MRLLFTATALTSAFLLFLVQPMVAKMVLPVFGGSPSVWTTCMVFFQALLLAGYTYAHLMTVRLGARGQATLHLALLALAVATVPLSAEGWEQPGGGNPVPWLLGLLATAVGLPFFVLSTSAPLLQRWFASTTSGATRGGGGVSP